LRGYSIVDDLTGDVFRREYCERLLRIDEIAGKYHTTCEIVIQLRRAYDIPVIRNRVFLKRKDLQLSDVQKQVVFGSLCGDVTIDVSAAGSCSFTVSHSVKQKEYLIWKARILRDLLSHESLFRVEKCKFPWSDREFEYVCIETKVAPIFNELRALFYPSGKKVISRSILDELTPLGLAVWFCDDGGFCGDEHTSDYDISGKWTRKEQSDIREWFVDRWNIDVVVRSYKDGDYVVFNVESARRLKRLIEPHIISSMQYKLGFTPKSSM
jgi:hypothetical protein